MFKKKAVSPVIAVALLLVTSVVAVVGFQGWFQTFSSSILSDVEVQNFDNQIRVEGIHNNILYLNSEKKDIINNFKIINNNGTTKCEISRNYGNLKSDTRLFMTFNNESFNGTHIKDLSENGNNAKLENNVNCLVQGLDENACVFDGNLSYNEIQLSQSLNLTNDFSVNLWFKVNNLFQDSNYNLINVLTTMNDGSSARYPYMLGIRNNTQFFFSKRNSSQSIQDFTFNSPEINNNWNLVNIVYDNNIINIYLNSQLLFNQTIYGIVHYSNEKLFIGAGANTMTLINSSFNGTIDEVSIYSKALNYEEVTALYNAKKALHYEQILPKGIKEINVANCNLTKGKQYDILAFTSTSKIEQTVIVK